MYDVIVVGGGIAGLVSSILLSRANFKVALFEKKSYPFHRVCGEYLSNEVRPFLERHGLFPEEHQPISISKFRLTSINGRQAELDLKMGGFGISRYTFDHFLFQKAQMAGVDVIQNATVDKISFQEGIFRTVAEKKTYDSKLVIGAYGKRSKLDRQRSFMQKKSPYIGVKYHIKTDLPEEEITLHNFKDGYCGISRVEDDKYNLCYLSHRNNLRRHRSIESMEQIILHENPYLKRIWNNAEFLFAAPLVINEISFEKKELIDNHILMCGDTAGMITPLCGNGMAMAIRSAKMVSDLTIQFWKHGNVDHAELEASYVKAWNKEFGFRLSAGRTIQNLFGSRWASNLAVGLVNVKPIGSAIAGLTHGKAF